MNRRVWIGLSVGLSLGVIENQIAQAGKIYYHQQRTRTRCELPKHQYGEDTPRVSGAQFAIFDAAAEGDSKRPGHFRATNLTVDQLRLDQVGLTLVNTPSTPIIATGRITHDGGDGGLIGNNVVIRLTAYIAPTADPTRIPADSIFVWESERELWVPRGRPMQISLTRPLDKCRNLEDLRQNFANITHLEVELSYLRDR